MESFHGHEILDMLIQSPRVYTLQKLQAAIHEKYGSNVVFHACGGENMSFNDLMQYLLVRGKIAEQDGTLIAFADKKCDHDD